MGHLFLAAPALLTLEVQHRSLLVYRPIDTDPVFPAAVTDDGELMAAAESDAEAPAPSPRPGPTWTPRCSGTAPSRRVNEKFAKCPHKAPTRDELAVAGMIGLANPGSFR